MIFNKTSVTSDNHLSGDNKKACQVAVSYVLSHKRSRYELTCTLLSETKQ